MKYVLIALGWIFGLLALLGGIILLFSAPLPAIPLLIIALLLLPPVNKYAHSKTGRLLPAKPKAVLIIVLLIVFGFLAAQSEQQEKRDRRAQLQLKTEQRLAESKRETINFFGSHKDSILSAIEATLESSKYDSAITLIERYRVTNDPDLNALNVKAVDLAASARKKAKEDSILVQLKHLPSDGYVKNGVALYRQLVELDPSNKTYSEKYRYFSDKYAAVQQEERQQQAKARYETDKKVRIENQFSAWNGAHRNLEQYIKEQMNDPDRYKHVETVYWDRGDYLVVKTTFRGKNAFGGVIKNSITAKVSLDGQILEILAQEP